MFGLGGLYEIAEMTRLSSAASIIVLLLVGLLPMLMLMAAPLAGGNPPPDPDRFRAAIILVAVLVVAMANVVVAGVHGPDAIPRGPLLVGIGALYVGPLFPFFALVRNRPEGIRLIVLMLLLVICADAGAYFNGRAMGRHKLAFRVSPGKTVEGAIGGIIASIIAGLILRGWLVPQWQLGKLVSYASMVAILAIIGDLANSAFKRAAGVKDSGWIFPGHGGLLDRTCSLVFAAVLTYYYSR